MMREKFRKRGLIMKNSKVWFLLVAVLMLFSLAAFGCEGDVETDVVDEEVPEEDADVEEPVSDTFVIARSTDAETLDTGYAYYEGEIDLMYHLYEGLVKFKDEDLNVEPWLAEDWDVNEEGDVWTFYLQEGVQFHDGSEFNADAVEFSFMRILDEDHPYFGLGDQALAYMDWLLGGVLEEVRAVDEYTVEFKLAEPFGPFLTYMGMYSQYIVSPTAVEEHGEDYYTNPSGTGPFQFSEWRRDEYIEMEVFDGYWGEKPEIEKIVWKVVPEGSTRLMELQAGQVHAIKSIEPAQLDTIQTDEEIELMQMPGANLFFAAINHAAEPFDDVNVRRAVMHAIDFDSLIDTLYEGLGTRAITPMPPTIFGFNEDIEPYAYDVEGARDLLAEAGYPEGFETTLHVFAESRGYIGRPVDAAEIIASDLGAAGIDAEVIVNEWGTHRSLLREYEHDIGFVGWFDVPHPNNFLNALLLRAVDNNYENEELNQLSDQALITYDRDEQIELYMEMQEIAHRDVAMLPIAHSDYTAAVSSEVSGFELDSLGNVLMHDVGF